MNKFSSIYLNHFDSNAAGKMANSSKSKIALLIASVIASAIFIFFIVTQNGKNDVEQSMRGVSRNLDEFLKTTNPTPTPQTNNPTPRRYHPTNPPTEEPTEEGKNIAGASGKRIISGNIGFGGMSGMSG